MSWALSKDRNNSTLLTYNLHWIFYFVLDISLSPNVISCNSVFRRGNDWIIATIEFRSFNFDLRLEHKAARMLCCRIRNKRYPRIIMFFKGSNVMKWTWSLQPKRACKTSGFPDKPEFLIFQALFQSLIGCSFYCEIMFTFISLSAVQLHMIHFFIFQKM